MPPVPAQARGFKDHEAENATSVLEVLGVKFAEEREARLTQEIGPELLADVACARTRARR